MELNEERHEGCYPYNFEKHNYIALLSVYIGACIFAMKDIDQVVRFYVNNIDILFIIFELVYIKLVHIFPYLPLHNLP